MKFNDGRSVLCTSMSTHDTYGETRCDRRPKPCLRCTAHIEEIPLDTVIASYTL